MKAFKEDRSSELYEFVVKTRRVVKVVKGGSKLSFSVLVVCGDKKGRACFAMRKDKEVLDAKNKSSRLARSSLVRVPLKESRTVHYPSVGDHCATRVVIFPAPVGLGVKAGGALRPLFEVLGIKDVVAKIIGSTTPHNVLRAAMKALSSYDTPKSIAYRLGKRVDEIVARRNNS